MAFYYHLAVESANAALELDSVEFIVFSLLFSLFFFSSLACLVRSLLGVACVIVILTKVAG
jgi:hypothetical protein